MFPLILLVLGLGVVLTAYELSPGARARIDDYARALRSAHEAHRAADVHLSNAAVAAGVAMQHASAVQHVMQGAAQTPGQVPWMPQIPQIPQVPSVPSMSQVPQALSVQQAAQQASQEAGPISVPQRAVPVPLEQAAQESPMPSRPAPPQAPVSPRTPPAPVVANAHAGAAQVATAAGIDHAIAATVANQQAAQSSADAVRGAKTEAERRAAADSAARVIERGKKIEKALASLGAGQCGVRSYVRVTPKVRDTILVKLHAEGMTVTGDNPWDVDTQMSGVKLRAVWDPGTQVLRLIVVASAFYASCDAIWERLDPTLRGIIGS